MGSRFPYYLINLNGLLKIGWAPSHKYFSTTSQCLTMIPDDTDGQRTTSNSDGGSLRAHNGPCRL